MSDRRSRSGTCKKWRVFAELRRRVINEELISNEEEERCRMQIGAGKAEPSTMIRSYDI